jgi:hypothetical protein
MDAISEISIKYIENYALLTAFNAIQGGYNLGREQASDVIEAQMATYTAVMDNHVCGACASLDGMDVDLRTAEGQQLYNQFSPAQHDGCRCVWLYSLEGDPDIPKNVGDINNDFEENFVNRYNKINETDLKIEEIAAKNMRHNVKTSGWIYEDDPWKKHRDNINNILKEIKNDKLESATLGKGLIKYVKSRIREEEFPDEE